MSTASWRRLDANCTSAIEPTIRSAQNESVRIVRAQLNSRGGRRPAMLRQARNVGQVPEVLGVVEPVADEEHLRGVEPDELRRERQVFGQMLVQQRAHLQTLRSPLL